MRQSYDEPRYRDERSLEDRRNPDRTRSGAERSWRDQGDGFSESRWDEERSGAFEGRSSEFGRLTWSGGPAHNYTGRGPKNYQRPDDRILEEVSDRLTDDPRVDASDVTVLVQNAEVTLSGTVRDREQKRRAEDVAERVSGVHDVINNLKVSRPELERASDSSTPTSAISARQGMVEP